MRLLNKLLAVTLIAVSIISCGKTGVEDGTLNSQQTVNEFIRSRCSSVANCELAIGESLPFAWTKSYYFDIRVEADQISEVIGSEYAETSGEYTRKWIFLNENNVVHIDEFPVLQIDEPFASGDIDFDLDDFEHNFVSFKANSIFRVHEIPLKEGSFLRLQCLSCR